MWAVREVGKSRGAGVIGIDDALVVLLVLLWGADGRLMLVRKGWTCVGAARAVGQSGSEWAGLGRHLQQASRGIRARQ